MEGKIPEGSRQRSAGRIREIGAPPALTTDAGNRTAEDRKPLVFRFRSSHHFAAHSGANFGIKGTLAMSTLSSAAYGFEVPIRDCRELIGTSNPPHWSGGRPRSSCKGSRE